MVAGNQQHAVEKADNYEPSIVQYQVLMTTPNKRMLIVHFMKDPSLTENIAEVSSSSSSVRVGACLNNK